jgi:UDP-N-acetylmuramoyl-L-alanyl-D-glutamate--2,6-diaminopimelate ligase
MRVSALLDEATLTAGPDPAVTGLTADSRKVRPGCLFAALPGAKHDGRRFIADAVRAGAVAVLGPIGTTVPEGIACIEARNPRRALAIAAARFYAKQPDHIVAVTGTSGKTSTVSFAQQLWTILGERAASLGTLGLVAPGLARGGSLTTADPVALHDDLAQLAADGVTHLAMEASSHGLDQYRLDGVRLRAAAFTSFSHEHLDYHHTMPAYLAAKLRLFEELLPAGATAVLNADMDEFADIAARCKRHGLTVIEFGELAVQLRLMHCEPKHDGQIMIVSAAGHTKNYDLNLVGRFQAMNVLAAAALVVACGAPLDRALAATTQLRGVPGRLEHVATRANGAAIFVDYAHKPQALEAVLDALRAHARCNLVCVFGCGGDRDAAKRPMMGEIATRLADRVIVTDDNPRGEDPGFIRRSILVKAPGATEIAGRREAIFRAVADLEAGDVLIIAGKGHEQGQIVGGVVHPFDDAQVARDAVAAADGARA